MKNYDKIAHEKALKQKIENEDDISEAQKAIKETEKHGAVSLEEMKRKLKL